MVMVTVQGGTVSPDFGLLVYRRRLMATVDMHRYEFKYVRSFADLFLLIIDSPVYWPLWSQWNSVGLTFFKHKCQLISS